MRIYKDQISGIDPYAVELLIGTRESMDSRVQAGLASPSPLQRTRQDSPEKA